MSYFFMARMEIIRLSSKGQIVIPKTMREGMNEGDEFVNIRSGKRILLERVADFSRKLEDDLEFARQTEEAWKEYERGEFESYTVDEFMREIEKW